MVVFVNLYGASSSPRHVYHVRARCHAPTVGKNTRLGGGPANAIRIRTMEEFAVEAGLRKCAHCARAA